MNKLLRNFRVLIFSFFNLYCLSAFGQTITLKIIPDLKANLIAVISDGDMYAQSYIPTEALPPFGDSNFQDRLTLFFQNEQHEWSRSSIEVPNSVAGTPEIMAVAPNRETIVVVETLGQRTPEAKTMKDLSPGGRVTVINIKDLKNPNVIEQQRLNFRPQSVDISKDSRWVVIGGDQPVGKGSLQGVISFFPLAKEGLKELRTYPISAIIKNRKGDSLDIVSLVQWGCISDASKQNNAYQFSAHLYRQNRIAFLKFYPNSTYQDGVKLSSNPVVSGPDPYVGRFIPGGGGCSRYVAADWGRNFDTKDIFDRLPNSPSHLSQIQLDGPVVEQMVEVPSSVEGIAVNQQGSMVAVISMQNTMYAVVNNRYSDLAKVSFYRVPNPPEQGLELFDRIEFEGILPEGGTFDLSGHYFFSAVYQDKKQNSQFGGLEVFRIDPQPNSGKSIQHLGRLQTPHGTHNIVIR